MYYAGCSIELLFGSGLFLDFHFSVKLALLKQQYIIYYYPGYLDEVENWESLRLIFFALVTFINLYAITFFHRFGAFIIQRSFTIPFKYELTEEVEKMLVLLQEFQIFFTFYLVFIINK